MFQGGETALQADCGRFDSDGLHHHCREVVERFYVGIIPRRSGFDPRPRNPRFSRCSAAW